MPMGLNMKNARTVSFIVLTALSATANSQSGKLNSPTALLPAAAGLGGIEVPESVSKAAIQVVTIPSAAAQINAGSMEEFNQFEASCKKGDANACVIAGKILTSEKPPKEIYDMSNTQRANRSIRSYESAINLGSLEAVELAYDLYYDQNLINRQLNSYTDKDRASELMLLMLSKQYPGGQIRQAREYIENPEYALSLSKKKEACQVASQLNNRTDLTDSTKKITEELNSGIICKIAN